MAVSAGLKGLLHPARATFMTCRKGLKGLLHPARATFMTRRKGLKAYSTHAWNQTGITLS